LFFVISLFCSGCAAWIESDDIVEDFFIGVGKRIKNAREQKGLSRKILSTKAGISEQFLRSVENGEKGLSAFSVHNIARTLSVTADYIIFGSTETERRHDLASLALASLSEEESKIIPQILEKVTEFYRDCEALILEQEKEKQDKTSE